MTDRDGINEIVEIDFEVGHISTIRHEPTTNHNPPRTHDWKIYLRSADVHGDLSCLIQRCVFYLHREFPNFKRELKSTPFAIQESGYAGFHLPIDIYFKTKKEPKKFRIEYDLDLHTNIEGRPARQKESYVRKYRCTFYDPDPEFRQKILAAGGKIKDTNIISTNNNESDESDDEEKQLSASLPLPSEPTVRHTSPLPKRPFSPVPAVTSTTNNKKVKVESSVINPKKKQPQQSIVKNENSTKLTVNNINTTKKSQLAPSNKSSPSLLEEKSTKTSISKEFNATASSLSTNNGSSEDASLSKPRPSTTKIKIENDNKPLIQSTTTTTLTIKKKEPVPSPSKASSISQVPLKKPIQMLTNKPIQKVPIKGEQTTIANTTTTTTTTSTIKSPPNVNIKRESSPNMHTSNSTTSTVSISSLKKIPKKVAPPLPPPPPIVEKRVRSPMTPPPSNRNSDRDSHRHQSSSSKNHSNSKRDRSSTARTTPPSSSINNSTSSRSGSSSNRSGKHNGNSRGRSRSRSRSRSRNRSSHQNHHNSRSHHSSISSRHSSQQKDRSNRHTSPHSHQSSISKSSSSSSHHKSRRTPTPPKSTRSPLRSTQAHQDPPATSNESSIPLLPSSINTPQSRSDSVEPPAAASTTNSPSTNIFHSEDDHTQTPMDIDGQSDDDVNTNRNLPLSDEQDQISPSSLAFVPNDSKKLLKNRNSQSDHSFSSLDSNESNDESNLSLEDGDDDLPTVLTNDDLRSKLIYIYNRFTSNSTNDLPIFVTFFKRHRLIDTSSKSTNGMFTYDLFSLNPLLIDELATDLGYLTNSLINRTEQ